MRPEFREPWVSFFRELDGHLHLPTLLHCLGGFVVTVCYGFPRATADIDWPSGVPADTLADIVAIAGASSALHRKHGVYLDLVTVATCPCDYEDRLIQISGS
jgi:hypothetical protein